MRWAQNVRHPQCTPTSQIPCTALVCLMRWPCNVHHPQCTPTTQIPCSVLACFMRWPWNVHHPQCTPTSQIPCSALSCLMMRASECASPAVHTHYTETLLSTGMPNEVGTECASPTGHTHYTDPLLSAGMPPTWWGPLNVHHLQCTPTTQIPCTALACLMRWPWNVHHPQCTPTTQMSYSALAFLMMWAPECESPAVHTHYTDPGPLLSAGMPHEVGMECIDHWGCDSSIGKSVPFRGGGGAFFYFF